jgi:hypothetical protein
VTLAGCFFHFWPLGKEGFIVTIRVYIPVSYQIGLEMLKNGFHDCRVDGQREGVFCEDRPREGGRRAAGSGVMVGYPDGPVKLCLDVPEEVYEKWRAEEATRSSISLSLKDETFPEGLEYQQMGYALIPAEVLNKIGRPQVYSTYFGETSTSRAELLDIIAAWGESHPMANELREELAFLDEIGWSTPLSLRESEEAPEDY